MIVDDNEQNVEDRKLIPW